ncbi:MAG TPA: tetratricopeptide repeat protein [Terracidiphilus sp.]|nr:tetratricopeptide repeat protein [Terracidiphilus sp.]
MTRADLRHWPSAMAVSAALLVAVPVTIAQTPASGQVQPQSVPAAPVSSVHQPPPVPLTPEQEGDAMLAKKRYQAAIASYNKIPEKSAAVWNKLGIANQLMFNLDEAARCYRESLQRNKKNASVMNNLGTVYDSQKDYRQAERMYRRALKVQPRSPLILKNLGTTLITQHKYKDGWKAYEAAISLDPTIFAHQSNYQVSNPTSVENRGAMNYFMARGCVRAGLREEAIDFLRRAINEGYTTPRKVANDAEFSTLHGFPPFEQLLAEQAKHP